MIELWESSRSLCDEKDSYFYTPRYRLLCCCCTMDVLRDFKDKASENDEKEGSGYSLHFVRLFVSSPTCTRIGEQASISTSSQVWLRHRWWGDRGRGKCV
jgi:hypothetical protein